MYVLHSSTVPLMVYVNIRSRLVLKRGVWCSRPLSTMWRLILLVEETGGPGENQRHHPCRKLLTNYQHNVVSSTPRQGVEVFQHLISLLRLQHSCSHLSSNRQLTLLQNNFYTQYYFFCYIQNVV